MHCSADIRARSERPFFGLAGLRTGPWPQHDRGGGSVERVRMRLFCFPYAGAGAAVFRDWPRWFPPEIEICPVALRGRDSRWQEPPIDRMAVLVERLATELLPFLDMPYALVGHSMGGIVAFELARHLQWNRGQGPVHLIVSAARAPQIPDPEPPYSVLP